MFVSTTSVDITLDNSDLNKCFSLELLYSIQCFRWHISFAHYKKKCNSQKIEKKSQFHKTFFNAVADVEMFINKNKM